MSKISSLLFILLVASCSTAPVIPPFKQKFESIPVGSTVDYVKKEFGDPNLFKDMSENKISFLSLMAYRTQGLFCIVYFEHGQSAEKGACRKDDIKAEYTDDESPRSGDFGVVSVQIKNTLKERSCFSYTDLFNVTRTSCE